MLVDMNAFFISCEMSRHAALKNKPAAVTGDPEKRTGIVLAANYEARSRGVRTAMSLGEALRKCPELLRVPPDHACYSACSRQVMDLLADFSPCLQQNSIDEAWLDMTGTRHLFGTPEEAAALIMDTLLQKLDLPCSIGISSNRFLAKMAADMKKPLGITCLWPADVETRLWPLPIQSLYGIGEKTADKLARLSIHTIGQLAQADSGLLHRLLGSHGPDLKMKARGIDPSPVIPHLKDDMKSIGRSATLAADAYDPEDVREIFLSLAEEVGIRARKHGKKGTTVQIVLKFNDFQLITRQVTVPATCYTTDLFQTGFRLLSRHWPANRGVRLIGISLGGFQEETHHQLTIFDALSTEENDTASPASSRQMDQVMDAIRQKHGVRSVVRGTFVRLKSKE